MTEIVTFVLICVVLLPFFMPFFIFPWNIVSSLIVGMFFGADAAGIFLIVSTLFYLCIVMPLATVYYNFVEERARKEKERLAADPAYALREQVRRAVIDSKLAALVLKNPKRHRAMMARKLGLSP